jgi:hypothetical protein
LLLPCFLLQPSSSDLSQVPGSLQTTCDVMVAFPTRYSRRRTCQKGLAPRTSKMSATINSYQLSSFGR